MKTTEFNESARLPRYTYRRSPVHDRSFLIMKYTDLADDLLPAGDYTVLDRGEDPFLSERKVINLISALNEREKLIYLGGETKTRQLFHMLHDGSDGKPCKVMFYNYDGSGVSKENALLHLEREDDSDEHP